MLKFSILVVQIFRVVQHCVTSIDTFFTIASILETKFSCLALAQTHRYIEKTEVNRKKKQLGFSGLSCEIYELIW